MKPIEYWVCAVTSGEPECWDGPYQTLNAAHASRLKTFPGPKFEVYRVQCESAPIAKGTVLNRPVAPKAKPRPKPLVASRAKAPVAPKARTQARAKAKAKVKVKVKVKAKPKPVRRAR